MEVKDGVVQGCSRTGGSHGWQLYSVSRWSAEDGQKLRERLEYEFEHGNRQIYWDDIAMFCYFDDFRLGIREMKADAIAEIDELDELATIDSSYLPYLQEAGFSTGHQRTAVNA